MEEAERAWDLVEPAAVGACASLGLGPPGAACEGRLAALQPSEHATPVLALIFLKYAGHRFAEAEERRASPRRRGGIGKDDDRAEAGAVDVMVTLGSSFFYTVVRCCSGGLVGAAGITRPAAGRPARTGARRPGWRPGSR